MSELSELYEIFTRICVCRFFRLSGLQEILQRTNFAIKPVVLIWNVGELLARDYVQLDNNFSIYVVNRGKAEAVIQELPESLFCDFHDKWHDLYQTEFEKYFGVEDLAALLYHEAAYFKLCKSPRENTLDFLKEKVQIYLWRYCRSVAEDLNIPLSVSISDLPKAFVTLISYMEFEHQDKRREVADYIPKFIQQIKDLNMFDDILLPSEYESFIEFSKSLNR